MIRSLRISLLLVVALATGTSLHAQEIDHTQYYLNLPGINPGFTGIEDYLDTRLSFRQGWNDFAVKNNYMFVSAYGALNNAGRGALTNNTLRISDPEAFRNIQSENKLLRKHGVGGMITSRAFGPYESTTINLNYAYHLPVSRDLMMSFGTKIGYASQRIAFQGLTVRDDVNDAFYQQIMRSNEGNSGNYIMDFGYVLYSSKFILGISSANIVSTQINSKELADIQLKAKFSAQFALTSVALGEDFSLSPGARITYADGYDLIWSLNSRIRFRNLLYAGLGYTNSSPKLSLLFGLRASDRLSINYAYDKYLSDLNNFNVNVHEITIGMSLFNTYRTSSKLW